MKKILYLCILAITISVIGVNIKPTDLTPLAFNAAGLVNTTINAQPALKMIFHDEFTTGPIRPSRWSTQLQWGRTNYPELQYYSPNAFVFRKGIVYLQAQKKSTHGMPYSSGALSTYKSFRFTYGVVKIRARIPTGKGLWPALWLLDYGGGAEEIDIMEVLGHQPNISYMTLHYHSPSGNKSIGSHYTGPNFALRAHEFSVSWRPTAITWYVDGIARYQITEHIPSKPMYLIMNLAVGGYWPGTPDNSTKFPNSFKIDYVRIYK